MTYQLGQLAAALEYLGTASSRVVEKGSRRAEALLPALQRAQVRQLERTSALIASMMTHLPADAFDLCLNAQEQGQYWLGYHHWKAAMRPERADDEPELDSRLEIRLEQPLKDWVHLNGGAAMIRRLLREARERKEER